MKLCVIFFTIAILQGIIADLNIWLHLFPLEFGFNLMLCAIMTLGVGLGFWGVEMKFQK